jgi:hypothetical protein
VNCRSDSRYSETAIVSGRTSEKPGFFKKPGF